MDVGRLCVKIAGRDAGKTCVIVDTVNAHTVLIDGATRRRKCNVFHLEPINKTVSLKKGASHDEVEREFKKLNIEVWSTKPKKEKGEKAVAHQKTSPSEPVQKEVKKKTAKKKE